MDVEVSQFDNQHTTARIPTLFMRRFTSNKLSQRTGGYRRYRPLIPTVCVALVVSGFFLMWASTDVAAMSGAFSVARSSRLPGIRRTQR